MLFKTLDWLVQNVQRLPSLIQWSLSAILLLTCAIPLTFLIVFWLKSEGYIASPVTTSLAQASFKGTQMLADHKELTKSMVQLNKIAVNFHKLQEGHSRDTRRLLDMFQFTVVEGCIQTNPKDLKKCDRLEKRLDRNK